MREGLRFDRTRLARAAAGLAAVELLAACSPAVTLERSIVRQNEVRAEVRADLLDEDEINVVLVGTAGPMSPSLAQNATAVFVGGRFFLFDAGDYAQKRMEQFNLPVAEIDAVFLTHFHNDHIADVGEVMQRSYLLGRGTELYI